MSKAEGEIVGVEIDGCALRWELGRWVVGERSLETRQWRHAVESLDLAMGL